MGPALLIAGTGALGCLFAARCARAGAEVAVLGTWTEGLAALRRDGVRLVEADGQERAYPVRAAGPGEACPPGELALVLVKAWQTRQAAGRLKACLAPGGMAVTLQNGLGNVEALQAVLGPGRAALGVTTAGATLLAPGRVRPAGPGAVSLSCPEQLAPLADLLRTAGFAVEFTSRPDSLVWGKLVISSAINPLTALLGVPNGDLLARPDAWRLAAAVALETAGIAGALGVALPYPDPVAAVESVARATAANRSSMLQDLERGRPTEIEAICGAAASLAESSGLAAPLNRALWRLVKDREAGALPDAPFIPDQVMAESYGNRSLF